MEPHPCWKSQWHDLTVTDMFLECGWLSCLLSVIQWLSHMQSSQTRWFTSQPRRCSSGLCHYHFILLHSIQKLLCSLKKHWLVLTAHSCSTHSEAELQEGCQPLGHGICTQSKAPKIVTHLVPKRRTHVLGKQEVETRLAPSAIIPSHPSGSFVLPVHSTLGLIGLEFLVPKRMHFHQGTWAWPVELHSTAVA
jgi:hypothetical protein